MNDALNEINRLRELNKVKALNIQLIFYTKPFIHHFKLKPTTPF